MLMFNVNKNKIKVKYRKIKKVVILNNIKKLYYCNTYLNKKLTRKELNNYKLNLKLTEEQKDIIVGCCLGDLYIRVFSNKGCLLFEQKNKEYLFHLYEKFKPFVRTAPKERKQQRLITSELKSTWYFNTITHNFFMEYHLLFYNNKIKYINKDLINHITPGVLAYWYMDDGSKNSNLTYQLATCSFTLEEHNLLIDILLKKFNIQVVMKFVKVKQKLYPILIISKKYSTNDSHLIFKDLISPYIIDSMKYKL